MSESQDRCNVKRTFVWLLFWLAYYIRCLIKSCHSITPAGDGDDIVPHVITNQSICNTSSTGYLGATHFLEIYILTLLGSTKRVFTVIMSARMGFSWRSWAFLLRNEHSKKFPFWWFTCTPTNTIFKYKAPTCGGFSVVKGTGTQLRYMMNPGLARWRMHDVSTGKRSGKREGG